MEPLFQDHTIRFILKKYKVQRLFLKRFENIKKCKASSSDELGTEIMKIFNWESDTSTYKATNQ